MSDHTRCALVLTCLLAATTLAGGPAAAQLRSIWALDDGTKIRATDTNHRLERGNGVFSAKAPRVRLFGARNETVAFQLILEGGAKATSKVTVGLASIGPIRNEGLSTNPDRYFIGRRIELFKQHYMKITTRSRTLVWEPWTASQPKGVDGWMPDALIPLAADHSLTVPARRNQGIWVDITIAKSTPPGKHKGLVTVAVDGRPCTLSACKLPVELEVLDLTLPDEPTAKTMLYFSGSDNDRDCMPARYFRKPWEAPQQQVDALRTRHFQLGRRHRITLFLGQDKVPNEALRQRLSGKLFTPKAGYEGPGEAVPQDIYSIHTYGGKLTAQQAHMWTAWFTRHAPKTTYFLYVVDEPPPSKFAEANRIAKQARPVPGFVTKKYSKALSDLSIFCAGTEAYSLRTAAKARAAGKQMWIYNGARPFAGTFMVDDVAISPRVNPWIQYKHGIPRWFYWEATYYNDTQGGEGQVDVWSKPINFRNSDGDRLNGDGLLFYPGRDVLFPKQDRRLDMPLPSIRLKNWRRGIQDVEYLALARKKGHGKLVDKLLATMIPKALADHTRAGAPVSWPEDGEKWLGARRMLADLLQGKRRAATDTSRFSAPAEPLLKRWKRQAIGTARLIGKKRLLALGAGGMSLLAAVVWVVFRRSRRHH